MARYTRLQMKNTIAETSSNTSLRYEFKQKLDALAEPFEVDEVYWLPQSTKSGSAVAAAYANKRAYTDRLDEVLGAECWQIVIDPPVATDYYKTIKEKRADWKDPTSAIITPGSKEKEYKVMIMAKCGIWVDYMNQWVWKASSGSAEAADENSITTAEAQAVKRAISMWGPGNYFYRLGTQTVPYDNIKKQFTTKPTLPSWAIPVTKCSDCHNPVTSYSFKRPDGVEQTFSAADILKNGRTKYQTNLCASCQTIRRDQK